MDNWLSKDDIEEFKSKFADITKELIENPEFSDMEAINQHLSRVFNYNVPHGKRARGLTVALAYRYFATDMTEEDIQLSYILGWCVEILQAFALIADDIMDGSETRRGNPCWYKVEDIGITAVNDALMLESAVYQVLKKHFRHKPYYVEILETFHDVTYQTVFGQSLDTRTALGKDLDSYNMELYAAIVKYKTSYYTYYTPVSVAMTMAGIKDIKLFNEVKRVALEIGHLFQIQDDYLDCFGNEKETGKIGTDIQDCKCSWLFITAMQNSTPIQREILKANYGKSGKANIDRVRQLYTELDVAEKYHNHSENLNSIISTHIQQMSNNIPKSFFKLMLKNIHGRKR